MFLSYMLIAESEEGARPAGEKVGTPSEIMVAETPGK
jgi:hypothetical protein